MTEQESRAELAKVQNELNAEAAKINSNIVRLNDFLDADNDDIMRETSRAKYWHGITIGAKVSIRHTDLKGTVVALVRLHTASNNGYFYPCLIEMQDGTYREYQCEYLAVAKKVRGAA